MEKEARGASFFDGPGGCVGCGAMNARIFRCISSIKPVSSEIEMKWGGQKGLEKGLHPYLVSGEQHG